MYLGKWVEAADAMKHAAEMSPHDHVMWRNLGDSYDQIPSRLADARQAYQRALETATEGLRVNPKDADVLSGIALYDAHLGHNSDAQAYITRAMDISPNNGDTLFTEALVYEIVGHRDRALTALQQAVKAGYSLEEIEKEPELRKLQGDPHYQRWLAQTKNFKQ
jgi:Flp pilus assembly protein TadD